VSILLDTTVLIDLLRDRPQTVKRLIALHQHGDVPFTTPISVEEVHRVCAIPNALGRPACSTDC